MNIRIASGFNKRTGYRHWNYTGMASIPFTNNLGQIIGLEVLPAADQSGDYVPVVHLENADDISIDIGTVNQGAPGSQPWKVDPSDVISPVAIATIPPVAVASLPELPAGTNTIGTVNQGTAGSSPWKVDASGVTLSVALTTGLPEGFNNIGGTMPAPTAS